jgi:uncharacterized protein
VTDERIESPDPQPPPSGSPPHDSTDGAARAVDYRALGDEPERSFAVVLATGDEVVASLEAFARATGVDAASFTAIGAVSDVTLGFFDLDVRDYRRIPLREQAEVVSLVGDITQAADDGAGERRPTSRERTVHGHIVVGRSDGSTLGGHLLEAHVRPTLEVIVTETPARLRRRYDPGTGLALIDLEGSDTAHRGEGGPTPPEA